MYLLGIGHAKPERAFSQAECWDILVRSPARDRLRERSMQVLEKVLLGDSGIDKRHFAVPQIERVFGLGSGELNAEFEREAPALACAALRKAAERAGTRMDQIDAVVVCTCTGYICPGISSHVAEKMGMRPGIVLYDLVGLGCGAAVPSLRAASGFLAAQPGSTVAVIAVEICSAAFYVDDDPGVLISLCLFGDGASATLWSGSAPSDDAWRCSGFDTLHWPDQREELRMENRGGYLRNRLARTVPELASRAVGTLFEREPETRGCEVVAHGGGKHVLDAVGRRLGGLELDSARAVLREGGNMSSPSVLMAAERRLDAAGPLWLVSFGAGFAAHCCRWNRGQ